MRGLSRRLLRSQLEFRRVNLVLIIQKRINRVMVHALTAEVDANLIHHLIARVDESIKRTGPHCFDEMLHHPFGMVPMAFWVEKADFDLIGVCEPNFADLFGPVFAPVFEDVEAVLVGHA